jgi:hypothetical protein
MLEVGMKENKNRFFKFYYFRFIYLALVIGLGVYFYLVVGQKYALRNVLTTVVTNAEVHNTYWFHVWANLDHLDREIDSFVSKSILLFLLLLLGIALHYRADFKARVNEPTISKAPGTRLLLIVDFLFRPATVELTFKTILADWHSEYFEALSQKRIYKSRWITFRYYLAFACAFVMALGLSKALSVFKQISKP